MQLPIVQLLAAESLAIVCLPAVLAQPCSSVRGFRTRGESWQPEVACVGGACSALQQRAGHEDKSRIQKVGGACRAARLWLHMQERVPVLCDGHGRE